MANNRTAEKIQPLGNHFIVIRSVMTFYYNVNKKSVVNCIFEYSPIQYHNMTRHRRLWSSSLFPQRAHPVYPVGDIQVQIPSHRALRSEYDVIPNYSKTFWPQLFSS